MQTPTIKNTIVFLILLAVTGISFASTPPARQNALRQSVLALDSAWTTAIKDMQDKKESGRLNNAEQQDYAKFITYLSSRIDYYCHLLQTEGGDQAVVDLPCAARMENPPEEKQAAARTKAEQVAGLDKSLSEALGEFDEQLLEEEQRLASRMPSERETGNGYGGSGGSGRSGQYGSGQAGGGQTGEIGGKQGQETSGSTAGNAEHDQNSTASSGSGAGAGSGQQEQRDDNRTGTQEIASGYDDIVARQLKEAAEKETDPELKKKLWEEYRKYKEGIN